MTWRPNDPGIPTWRPPKSIDPSLIPGPRRWILILTSAKNTTNCASAPLLVGSANGQTNYIHPGKLTFPTQWWFGSDDWVSFRWSMVIFRGVKCLQRTWINARWRRNFLEPSPLPKHFLYPYSLLTCTPSLKELMYTPENKRLKPEQGPKRKRQNIDPNHQFLASSRSFLGVYQISIEPHTSRQKGQDFLGTPDARMWSHPPASWLEKFGAGKYPPWVGSTPHAGCNRQHQNSETFLDSGIPKIPTNQPSFETGILGGRSKSWGMSETPWGLKVFQLNGWFLFPLKKAMMTPTSPWIPHWIHQVLWQGVPFCEGLGGRGLVASFPCFGWHLDSLKKGERQACSDHWVREMLPKKMWIFGVKDLHQGPQQNARMWDATDHKTRSQSRAPSSNNTENEEGWQRLQHHQSPCYPFTPPMQC